MMGYAEATTLQTNKIEEQMKEYMTSYSKYKIARQNILIGFFSSD